MTKPLTTPSTIEALIAETIQAAVEARCITDVPEDDESRANHVIIGKPTRELRDELVISVHMQHPFGPRLDRDQNITGTTGVPGPRPWKFPAETIGGATFEEIIGCVQIRLRQRTSLEDAMWIFSAVKERVKQAINLDKSLKTLTDGMGNTMFLIETFRAIGYDSGGAEVSLTTQWVDFRALVSRSNCRET